MPCTTRKGPSHFRIFITDVRLPRARGPKTEMWETSRAAHCHQDSEDFMSVDAADIRAAFASCNLDIEEDAAITCVSICTEFGLSSKDMAAQWDAYSVNQQLSGAANTDSLKHRHFKTPVVKREAVNQDKLESLYNMKSPEGKHARSFSSPAGSNKVQRTNGMFSPSSLQSPPGNAYENRTDVGKTVSEFNSHLKKQIEGLGTNKGRPVQVLTAFPSRNQSPGELYMYTPLFQRALALDEQLAEIVCEAAEGKLNPSVVQIEGSRKTCGGQRVLLDLSGVPNFQIFPGKIVALEGVFPDTRSPMTVKRFLEPIPAPLSTTSTARIKEIQSEHGMPVRVLIACGPFTTSSNVDYLPLNDLLQIVLDQTVDVLILVGPFIDSMHPMFQDGLVKYDGMMLSFEDTFVFKVMTLLNNVLARDERIQIVIVPSLRDANHLYVYPQHPLNKKKACEAFKDPEYAKRIHFMSNPSTFSINEIVFGISTLDVVVQLSSNELYRAQTRDPNRLLRLCEQVIDQRSYYPIFPPPPGSEAPIDLRYMKQYQFEQTPDVLLLPSILNRFCGRAKDSICINPGQLCKGESGGTFADITILPLSTDKIESAVSDKCIHFVSDRTIVEIKRI
ncbi:unnamed protein product [Peronospora belbahrii]|uniref:DNA polymerase alpha subunit B n=1 Tax=Peronospora belbahrii TaxID=622444 RepID=A0ABN8D4M9_9STRA|nr:unnamed protein product [Peronospora belbahrii]